METVSSIIQLFVIIFFVRTLLNFYRRFLQTRDTEESGEYMESSTGIDDEIEKEIAIEMVHDEICGRSIPKNKSYILPKPDKTYHFCSWECRQKFIDDHRKK
ncbi:MAG: hypothetical protein ACOYVK_07675 [Bacillota bacterium]